MRFRLVLIFILLGSLAAGGASSQSLPDRWATFRHDYQRTGRTTLIGPQDFSGYTWKQAVASGVAPDFGIVSASPAIGLDGNIYISGRAKDEMSGGVSTYLAAIRSDGFLLWRESLGSGQTDSSPSLSSNDTVYIGTGYSSGATWGIESFTKEGVSLWKSFNIFDRVLASPTLSRDEKSVYVGDQSGIFFAYDITRVGASLWNTEHFIGHINSSAALGDDGILYFGSDGDGGRINAISPNGALVWSFPIDGELVGAPALSRSGILYFATIYGVICALDTKTVTASTDPEAVCKWKNEDYHGSSSFIGSVALAWDDTVYAGNTDGHLVAFDPNTGRRKWSFDVATDGGDASGAIISSPAVGGDQTIYFGCDNGVLYAIVPETSGKPRLKAKYNVGIDLESSPAIGPDGTLYIGAGDGFLYAFGRRIPGDVNKDGKISVSDVIMILQTVVNGNPSPDILSLGDVSPRNEDGTFGDRRLDIGDAVRLLRYLVKLDLTFPN